MEFHSLSYTDVVSNTSSGNNAKIAYYIMIHRLPKQFKRLFTAIYHTEDYYSNTLIPDESFFQTVLMNTSFNETIVNDDKRTIIWVPEGRIKLRPKTLTNNDLAFLLNNNDLFARKFDDSVDGEIINSLDLNNLNFPNDATNTTHITLEAV